MLFVFSAILTSWSALQNVWHASENASAGWRVPKERSGSRNRAALVKSWLMVEISILLFLVGLTMFFFGRYDLSYTEWGLQTFINQLS